MTTLPCLNCGRALTPDPTSPVVTCTCGALYAFDLVTAALEPGAYRHWVRAFACACPGVDRTTPTDITVSAHMCPTSHGFVPIGAPS